MMYHIDDLTCNGLRRPKGIDEKSPLFSWKLSSDRNNTFQIAYRIVVKSSGALAWDSGKVPENRNIEISYQGESLRSGVYYQWQVESWNNHGETAKSAESFFLTGIMDPALWQAEWIETGMAKKPLTDLTDAGAILAGKVSSDDKPEAKMDPAAYLRKEFVVHKPVKQALVYAAAHGIYELRIDRTAVSNLLAPEYTSYAEHLEYQTYDVTALLEPGVHVVSSILADGWYTGKIGLMGIGRQYGETNAFFMQLEILYEDDTRGRVITDEFFKWSYGAYDYADLFVGEYYDARKEPDGYDIPGYDDMSWQPVQTRNYGSRMLKGQSVAPVSVLRTITPAVRRTPKGEWVLDAGENIVGYTACSVTGTSGQEIGLEHSEVLDLQGNFLQNILGQNKHQKDRFICGANGENSYCPKFTFHGFRYVRVTGLAAVRAEDFIIHVIGSNLQRTGWFRTSDPKINQLQENIFRSQQGNMLAIPTDCPQRERAGWTGDMQIYAPTAVFLMDMQAFLKRWLYDMRLEQLADGQIPHVIPAIGSNKYIDGEDKEQICSAGWADACVIVPYRLHRAYGGLQVLQDNYDMMKRWMAYVEAQTGESCLWNRGFHFGDWLIPSIMQETGDPMETAERTREEVATAMYAYTSGIMTDIATALGDVAAAEHYRKRNLRIRTAFSDTYVGADGGMRHPYQGLYVLALQMDLVDAAKKAGCIQHLVELIHQAGDCLDCGFLSVPFLLDTLCECGEQKLAYKLLYQEAPPSWLYAVNQGATTIWERWSAILPDGTRTHSSYNHFALGCVGDFMYRHIGGIRMEEPGYKKIRIEPDLDCGLDWAEGELDSRYGKIKVSWSKGGGYALSVSLPPNTSGVVAVNGRQIEIGNGITLLRYNHLSSYC